MNTKKSMVLLFVAGVFLISGCAGAAYNVKTDITPKAVPRVEAPASRPQTLPTALPLPTEPAAPF